MFVYLVPAEQRLQEAATERFEDAVQAVRMGTVFAYNKDAYRRWLRRKPVNVKGMKPLTGEALEREVQRIAQEFPQFVERVT